MGNWPFATRRVAVATVGLLTLVLFLAACGRGMAGGAGVGAPPAEVSGAANSSGRYADEAAWLCGSTTLCGSQATRIVLGPDAAPHTIVESMPAADCFIVHPAGDDGPPPGEVVRPLPTARALAKVCRVYAPNLTQTSVTATPDDALDAFRHYVENENDGRPFVVVSDATEGSRMSLAILDEIRSRQDLNGQHVASILPGIALDFAAEALEFCTVLEHLRCVISAPVVRDPNVAGGAVPGISSGWAGACVNPADVEGRPALLPDWMVVDDGTSTVDCDVLALVHAKVEAVGLTNTTDGR